MSLFDNRDDRGAAARKAAKTKRGNAEAAKKPLVTPPPVAELFPVKGVLGKLFGFLTKLSAKK